MEHHPHLVIGAGISGLGAAYFAARAGVPTLVLERAPRLGGCMHTHVFRELDDFWLEAGSHSCFNSYGTLLEILDALEQLPRLTAKAGASYLLWGGGRRRSIVAALHPLELLWSLPRLVRLDKNTCTVAEYYGRGLGRRNYENVFGPAFRSVICQPADDFPAAALFRKKPRRKDVRRSFTLPGGLNEIPALLAAQPGVKVRLDQRIAHLEREGAAFVARLEDGSVLCADALTLAVPPDAAARLLAGIAPAAAALVGRIGVAEIDTLLLAFEKTRLIVPRLAGLISVDGPFWSAVSRDFLDHPRYRGFAFHFPGGCYDHDTRLAAACAALGVAPTAIGAQALVANRLPSLRRGHQTLIAELDRMLAGQRLAVTGNWFLGVSIEDCLTRSHSEHRRLFGDAAQSATTA